MNKLSIFFFACCVFLSNSLKADVYDNMGSRINVIIEERDDGEVWAKFEYCQVDQECETLGSREFYSLQELREIRSSEFLENFPVFVGYVILVSATFGLGIIAMTTAGAVTLATNLVASVSYVIGSVVYSMGLKEIIYDLKEDLERAKTLAEDVLEDSDLMKDEEELSRFAGRLSLVLSKIDAQDGEGYQTAAEASYP